MKKNKIKKYQITLTEKQVHVLMDAMEIFARLGMGQFRYALERLPLTMCPGHQWQKDLDEIGNIISKHTKGNVDGWRTGWGIGASEVNESAKIAWDIYQVVRQRISWEGAVERGTIPSLDSPRKWFEMGGVNFDAPMVVSNESLAKIEGVE